MSSALAELSSKIGRVRGAHGLTLSAHVPGARRGDWVRIARRDGSLLDAEVVAFDGELVTLMPLGDVRGVGADDPVTWMAAELSVPISASWLGRVVDGFGQPLDGGPSLTGEPWSIRRAAPPAFTRPAIERVLVTGVRAIDGLCTVGEGQRIGLFAPAGVGKTTLLAQLAARASADVIVIGLIGERGRELREFLDNALSASARPRAVVVCATSDAPALVRMKSAHLATAVAEYFRAQGKSVLLLVDSLTRFVRAAREVGLAAGEPPARRGFPPSAFAELAPLLERAGRDASGSITAFYTVLVEGNDFEEPVADELRGLLDGHLVLDRALFERGIRPAIDIPRSLSRLMDRLITPRQRSAAEKLRSWLSKLSDKRELVALGAVQAGADPVLDLALARAQQLDAFLQQQPDENAAWSDTLERLSRV